MKSTTVSKCNAVSSISCLFKLLLTGNKNGGNVKRMQQSGEHDAVPAGDSGGKGDDKVVPDDKAAPAVKPDVREADGKKEKSGEKSAEKQEGELLELLKLEIIHLMLFPRVPSFLL